jgi:hypothetical protein
MPQAGQKIETPPEPPPAWPDGGWAGGGAGTEPSAFGAGLAKGFRGLTPLLSAGGDKKRDHCQLKIHPRLMASLFAVRSKTTRVKF